TYIGAVVRDEIFTGEKEKGYQLLLNTSNKAVLLVMGGSIGSQNLNRLIRDNLKALLDNFQIIHICGKDNIDKNFDVGGYTQFEYLNEDLKDVYAITDFVLSRAGANAIFEFL